jgi:hypothetical protein
LVVLDDAGRPQFDELAVRAPPSNLRGFDPSDRCRRLGHASLAPTLPIYVHLFKADDRAAIMRR